MVLYDVMLVNNWGVFLAALREFSTRLIENFSFDKISNKYIFRWSQLYLVSWWFMSNVYILALVLGFIVEVCLFKLRFDIYIYLL